MSLSTAVIVLVVVAVFAVGCLAGMWRRRVGDRPALRGDEWDARRMLYPDASRIELVWDRDRDLDPLDPLEWRS